MFFVDKRRYIHRDWHNILSTNIQRGIVAIACMGDCASTDMDVLQRHAPIGRRGGADVAHGNVNNEWLTTCGLPGRNRQAARDDVDYRRWGRITWRDDDGGAAGGDNGSGGATKGTSVRSP